MNRAVVDPPTTDGQPSVSAITSSDSLATQSRATSSASPQRPLSSEHTSIAVRRKTVQSSTTTTTTRAATGKRKRSRAQMTTALVQDSRMDESHDVQMLAVAAPKRARPSLGETQPAAIHSDEDEDAVRFSVPPPPPTIPVAPELLCRYPNKPCPQARATKKHGELHSYCAYHRFKAQQYQRKLEQKKRERRLREQRSAGSPSALLAATSLSSTTSATSDTTLLRGLALESSVAQYHSPPSSRPASPPVRRQGVRARTRSSPPRPSSAMYGASRPAAATRGAPGQPPIAFSTLEPYHHPVSLQDGDLQLLQVFLWDSESPPTTDPAGARPTGPSAAARPTTTATRSDGSDAYNVSLDGFTFTSESI